MTETLFCTGGTHVQYNVVSRETLLDAQKNPEKYRGLVVRVAGYSAFFTALDPTLQNDQGGQVEDRPHADEQADLAHCLGAAEWRVEFVGRDV